jgi:hypothetical protein
LNNPNEQERTAALTALFNSVEAGKVDKDKVGEVKIETRRINQWRAAFSIPLSK